MISNVGIIYGALAGASQFLETFKDFPPSQRAASFTIDQVVEKMRHHLGNQ
jgi:arylsulfatase